MYVQSGLGAYRRKRGMGDTVVTDPTTGVSRVVTSAPITTETVSTSGQSVYTDASGNVVFAPAVAWSLTDWLNTNSTMVAVGAGVVVLMFLFARGR